MRPPGRFRGFGGNPLPPLARCLPLLGPGALSRNSLPGDIRVARREGLLRAFLLQQAQRKLRLGVCLRQNRYTGLLQDLRLRQGSRFGSEVGVLDTSA